MFYISSYFWDRAQDVGLIPDDKVWFHITLLFAKLLLDVRTLCWYQLRWRKEVVRLRLVQQELMSKCRFLRVDAGDLRRH